MHTFLKPRLLQAGAAAALLAVPVAALAAPVKLTATLNGGTSADPDGSGTFAADVDADLGDFCYTLNLAKLGKVTSAAIHHRPLPAVLRFATEIRNRLDGIIPARHFIRETA